MVDELFEYNLKNGRFKMAFDVLGRRFVQICQVHQDDNGSYSVLARRVSDGIIHRYRVGELTDFR